MKLSILAVFILCCCSSAYSTFSLPDWLTGAVPLNETISPKDEIATNTTGASFMGWTDLKGLIPIEKYSKGAMIGAGVGLLAGSAIGSLIGCLILPGVGAYPGLMSGAIAGTLGGTVLGGTIQALDLEQILGDLYTTFSSFSSE